MAATSKPSKWGSFLSQAVAGVESRLDNMLGESPEAHLQDAAPASLTSDTKLEQSPQQSAPPSKASPGALKHTDSRSSSRNRVNDRLQARLVQAMAGKNPASGPASRGTTSARSSLDLVTQPSSERQSTDQESEPAHIELDAVRLSNGTPASAVNTLVQEPPPPRLSLDADSQNASQQESSSQEAPSKSLLDEAPAGEQIPPKLLGEAVDDSNWTNQLQELTAKQQEEIQGYLERIDSLQSKLQYLSKAAAESAKKAASSASSGSHEQKLAEKEEKIALLMEEGQKLSANEQKLRTTIRKLRAQMGENEKQVAELKKNRDKALADAEALHSRLHGSAEMEKHQEEAKRLSVALQKEIDALKKENNRKDEAHRRLDQEWKEKMQQAETSHRDAMNRAVATERQQQKTLEDAISVLRTEKEAEKEKARQSEIEWREKLERAHERGRKTEEELKIELQAMERKLEAMRITAEEASSGSGGEAQVKMFRQVETLQSQYASARENWQGIEASLIAKSATMEKERDEAHRRESEMRKKARDAAVRLRHLEQELQDAQPSLAAARQELEACRSELTNLQVSCKESQDALARAQEELEKMKLEKSSQSVTDKEDFAEAERSPWPEEMEGATFKGNANQNGPESPLMAVARTFSSDMLWPSSPGRPRKPYTPGSGPGSPAEAMSPPMRRFSGQPPLRTREPSYAGSGAPPTPFSPFETPSESAQPFFPVAASTATAAAAAAAAASNRENGAADTVPSSPRNMAQDMISVSTVAAGPSVQLVERMSAAIRRLEAEKVTAKEEMTRVCSQRDEARADLVGLMKELEAMKTAAAKIPGLEQEVVDLDARYQTTLEMLGEKSELVEELKADVEDVKTMYRELVERTVK